uniref:WAS/WASL-interacting protein family member 2 n=1 Tax=Zeugodacus cucurbitae TaxID=28588 RepID=A0A0A1X434_ZEUCU
MKSPRSPPIAAPGAPIFPTQQHFGTMRTPLAQLCQSQEAINSSGMRPAPNPPIGRPTVAPPKPPSVKPPPPPTPARSVSNSNLNSIVAGQSGAANGNAAIPYSAVNSTLVSSVNSNSNNYSSSTTTQPPSTSSSSSSVSALRDQFRSTTNGTPPPPLPPTASAVKSSSSGSMQGSPGSPGSRHTSSREKPIKPIILNGGPLNAPPLPPHRTVQAPPPPLRQTSNTGNSVAPVPPQRHSSIRANAPLTPPTANNNNMPMFGNNAAGQLAHANSVSRLITDLESRFVFHNVTEFPKPPPFLNIPKIYTAKANGM